VKSLAKAKNTGVHQRGVLGHFRMILSSKRQAPSLTSGEGYRRIYLERIHMKLNKQQMDQAIEILKKTIPGAKTEKRKDMENIVKFFVKLNEFCDKNKYTLTEDHWKYINKRLKEDEKKN